MRKIHFRAWDGEKMHYNVVPWTWDFVISLSWSRCERSTGPGILGCGGKEADFLVPGIAFKEIMQFTGLLDCQGKEIYEGDIVVKDKYIWFEKGKPNYRGTIEWILSQWQVVAHCVNPDKAGISDGINEELDDYRIEAGERLEWEVIGNIYENPELLEKP